MRTLVLGDVHGNYKALIEAFERCNLDYENDKLIFLGDVYDGYPDPDKCVEEFKKIKNLILIKGNHDVWTLKWFNNEWIPGHDYIWLTQGGFATQYAYQEEKGDYSYLKDKIEDHRKFLEDRMVLYHIDDKNCLYIHAGIDWNFPIDEQPDPEDYYWDRTTWGHYARQHDIDDTKFPYEMVFIGHTHTDIEYPDLKPVKLANLWNLDQGAGYNGKLTIMDAYTEEYWQSDYCKGGSR